jgi:C4-dicarboxylate-specific signal transduction histidine kinase
MKSVRQARANVLLVDREGRASLRDELASEGYEVECVADAPAALAAVRTRKFDLAVTGLHDATEGPDVRAVELLREADPELEIVVATGVVRSARTVEFLRSGPYQSVRMPNARAELALSVERAVQRSALAGEVALYRASQALLADPSARTLPRRALELAAQLFRASDVRLTLEHSEPVTHRHGAELLSESRARTLAEEARTEQPSQDTGPAGTAIGYRLECSGKALGTLVVARQEPFTSLDVQRGSVFAGQLALSLENARLYGELGAKVEELVRTRERLVHAEKLSLAGRLAAAVAHEVNNPLSSVLMNLDAVRHYADDVRALADAVDRAVGWLDARPDADARSVAGQLAAAFGATHGVDALARDIRAVVDETAAGIGRVAELVAGFRRLSDPEPASARQPVDVHHVLEELRELAERQGLRVEIESELGACTVVASRVDLRAALVGLASFLSRSTRGATSLTVVRVIVGRERRTIVLEAGGRRLTADERARIFDPRVELEVETGALRLNLELAHAYQRLARNHAELRLAPGDAVGFEIAFGESG